MITTLTYGKASACELDAPNIMSVRANAVESIAPADIADHVQGALANPCDYPPLESATVPGDTVTIAVDHDTPQLIEVVAGTLAALRNTGVENSNITVLLTSEFDSDKAAQEALRKILGDEISLVVHHPDDPEQLAMLGVTQAGLALRLNRILCDADLVIPISPTRGGEKLARPVGSLFPRFSDSETIGRFNAPASQESENGRAKLAEEITESDWMLGVGLALQVVPGPSGEVASVCCGTPQGVAKLAGAEFERIWSADVSRRADLVVATIVGDASQQTWQNLSRALEVAEDLLEPGGAIAICSEIARRPGASGKRLHDAQDLASVEKQLLKDQHADSAAALALCRQLQRGTVYLKSNLSAGVVEALGLAPISSDQELARLAKSYRQCLVLEEAQHLEPRLAARP
jgi:nickel-dependent lactate racemase